MSTLQTQTQLLASRIATEFNNIRTDIATVKNSILGSGVIEAYDTIKEVADKALANKELIDNLDNTANTHVAYTTQSKTDSEKEVARTNIGAMSSSDVDTKISIHNSDSSAHPSLISHVDTVKASIDSTAQTVATNATKAQTSEANASSYSESALSSKNDALEYKNLANTSATSAKESENNASASEAKALSYKNSAEAAMNSTSKIIQDANVVYITNETYEDTIELVEPSDLETLETTVYNYVTNAISESAYSLPNASDDVLGGIKVGSGLSIDENGVLSVSLTNGEEVSY